MKDGKAWGRALWEGIKRNRYVLLVVLAGAALLLLPSLGSGEGGQVQTAAVSETDLFQTQALEARIEQALSSVEGAGQVEVVLTLRSSARQVLAQDSQETVREEGGERALTPVVLSREEGEQPVVVQQISPQYQGALVVCSGGDNPGVRLQLVEAVSALTGLGADRISVCKGK